MNVHKHQQGIALIATIFLLVVASFFIVILHETRENTSLYISGAKLELNDATRIAELGAEVGLNEWLNNQNAASNYSVGTNNVLSDEVILNGLLDLTFTSTNFSNAAIVISSTGKVNNAAKTIVITVERIVNKELALVTPNTPDLQYDDRKTSLTSLGWKITEIDETDVNLITTLSNSNFNLIYLPVNISINTNTLSNIDVPICSESISDSQNFGLLSGVSLNATSLLITSIEAQATSQSQTSGSIFNFANTAAKFKTSESANLVGNIVYEFSNSAFTALDQQNMPSIFWLPTGELRSDITATPKSRIILNLHPSNSEPWSDYTNDGINLIGTLLDHVACSDTVCYTYTVIGYDYQ